MGENTSFVNEKEDDVEKISILSTARTRTFSFSLPGRVAAISIPDGWKFGVLACAVAAGASFFINFLITVVTLSKFGVDRDGKQVLYDGNCDTVERLNTAIHFFINAMSTILLGSSNYTMQCLSAATREEIDAAHRAVSGARSIDIGTSSLRNLFKIKRERVWLWLVLATSSIPLHLFYNSAVFSSLATYSHPIVASNEAFAKTPASRSEIADLSFSHTKLNMTWLRDGPNGTIANGTVGDEPLLGMEYAISGPWRLREKALAGNLTSLSMDDCIVQYSRDFLTDRGGVILILDTSNSTNTSLPQDPTIPTLYAEDFTESHDNFCIEDRYAWMCGQDAKNRCTPTLDASGAVDSACSSRINTADVRFNTTGWMPLGVQYPVARCLSEELPQRCRLLASFHIVLLVLLLNLAKAIVMCRIVFFLKEKPVLTIGDAVASFLERPEPLSENMCLLSQRDMNGELLDALYRKGQPKQFLACKKRWHKNVTRRKIILFWAIYCVSGAFVMLFLLTALRFVALSGANIDATTLWDLGFGSVSSSTTITWTLPQIGTSALFANSFVANSPQIILSVLYFTYNSIFTALFAGLEWQSYMINRKGLRISDVPRGEQRATYFLELPYRAAIPLMIGSGLIHWLVGQSLFLVDIEGYSWNDRTGSYSPQEVGNGKSTITCGFSPLPMILALLVGFVMAIPLIWFCLKKYTTSMPVVASNSFAISAACHPNKDEEGEDGAAVKKVRWGVVGAMKDDVGHISFSCKGVEKPVIGTLYA